MKIKILPAFVVGVFLLSACSGNSKFREADKVGNADTAALAQAGDTATHTKLIKTADMRLKVKSVREATEKIAALTLNLNGTVIHDQMQSTLENSQEIRISDDSIMHVSSFNTVADMTVSIPPAKLEDFMTRVSQMGLNVDYRKMNIEDKTLDYLSSKLKLENRTKAEARQKDKDPATDLVEKDDIVDRKISNLKVNQESKMSTVILSLYQSKNIVKEVVANDDPAAYQLSLSKRFVNALTLGWSLFAQLVIGIANGWAFILAAIILWMGFRYYKRRHPTLFGSIKS